MAQSLQIVVITIIVCMQTIDVLIYKGREELEVRHKLLALKCAACHMFDGI